jgi:hypothetical protein
VEATNKVSANSNFHLLFLLVHTFRKARPSFRLLRFLLSKADNSLWVQALFLFWLEFWRIIIRWTENGEDRQQERTSQAGGYVFPIFLNSLKWWKGLILFHLDKIGLHKLVESPSLLIEPETLVFVIWDKF